MKNEKTGLHPRNKHRFRYDFKQLIKSFPSLGEYVVQNKYGDESIDFFNPQAVSTLNKALLKHFYQIEYWDIPKNYLTPPIPGRADYIHHIADLLANSNNGVIPMSNKVVCMDIGVGANCIYPIIGNREYGWSFIGTDIDPVSIKAAKKILELNPLLGNSIELRLQQNSKDIFYGVIQDDEFIDITICNPPFHASLAEAQSTSLRKLRNLKQKKVDKPELNFAGQGMELWCVGGELGFVRSMIVESKQFSKSCMWYTTLISKESNLKNVYKALEKAGVIQVQTIPMAQGNKKSRIVAWSFLGKKEHKKWINTRWT